MARRVSKRVIAKGMPSDIKKAALAVLDSGKDLQLGDLEQSLVSFSQGNPGIFDISKEYEEYGPADTYNLRPEWRTYLSRHRKYLET